MKSVLLLPLLCAGLLLACSSGNEPDGDSLIIPWYRCYTDVLQMGDTSRLQTKTFIYGHFCYVAENGHSSTVSSAIFPSQVVVNGVDYTGDVDESGAFSASDTSGKLLAPVGEYNVWEVVEDGDVVLSESIERSPMVIVSLTESDVYSLSEPLTIKVLGKISADRPVNITVENRLALGEANPDAAKLDTVLSTGEPLILEPERMAALGFRSGTLEMKAAQIVTVEQKAWYLARRSELRYGVYHRMTVSVEE